ncbi:MAG: hypothetical protein HY665_03195 [Chloroflexi bacterium]|nr:hypothetical protein [Chloroflexota bacterium]
MGNQTMAVLCDSLEPLEKALELKRPRIQAGVQSWAASNHSRYPWRQPGKTPYEVFIGEALLDKASARAIQTYPAFIQRFPSLQSLAKAPEEDLHDLLSNFRLEQYTRQLRFSGERTLKEGHGQMPRDTQSLAMASGLPLFSVRIVMCFGYSLPVAVTDSNTEKMLCRLFQRSLPAEPGQGLIKALGASLLPERNPQQYNSAFLDIGEQLCKHLSPRCDQCPVIEACDHAESLPLRYR